MAQHCRLLLMLVLLRTVMRPLSHYPHINAPGFAVRHFTFYLNTLLPSYGSQPSLSSLFKSFTV